jgi:superfamily II DNA or RNA helicase
MTSLVRSLQRGEAVRVRGERWHVLHVSPHDGCEVVELAGGEPSNAGRSGRFLLPFEPLDRLPATHDEPRVVRSTAWRSVARASLADAVPAWCALRGCARADIALWPFQLEPVLAMTRGLACRFLLADEVGLGKTIQAGLLVVELLAREREARVLIVTPASLRDQWRDELRDRFAVEAAVIDAEALVREAACLPDGVNPWAIPQVAITSIDFLKRADVIRSLEPLVWDLVAFDEAHALCGRSDRALAADLVAARARRVVIITATPHSGDEAAFERLRALGRVGASDDLLTFRRSRLEAGIPRARVMRRLCVTPTVAEARMHRALRAYAARVARDAPAETAAAARLAMIVLARRATSSATSLARSIERRIALIGTPGENRQSQLPLPLDEGHLSEDEEPIEELAAPGLRDSDVEEHLLRHILRLAQTVGAESKIGALRRLRARTGEPALVFTEYRDTLRHVALAVGADAAMLHGGLTAAERAHEARRFTHGEAPILLATDAASEGLNLHRRCRLVINLDVPWTPLRLEQRVGRVDRLGQTRRVHAVTFVARGTSEALVAAALSSRSLRAEREAPFGRDGEEAAHLHVDAQAEAERLAVVRQLARVKPARWSPSSRPVLTLLSSPRRHELLLALRFLFVDATGATVWDTIQGVALANTACRDRRARAVRRWFERSICDRALALAAASAVAHETGLTALRRDMRTAIAPVLVRERAMLERLTAGQARLAAPLIQPGLFDRRAIRDAEAQQRVAAEAAARAMERIGVLERQCDVHLGERSLVFAVSLSR